MSRFRAPAGRLAAHAVQSSMSVELVHVVAHFLVGTIGVLHPLWIWVKVSDGFREVDEAAEKVGQPVNLLDLHEEISFLVPL